MDTHSPKLKSALDLVIDFLLARSEELVEIRAASGQVELRIRLTEQGPVLHMEAVRLKLKATAARRELAEETGYTAPRWRHLGSTSPNPAIQGNRLHTYLALDAACTEPPSPDDGEALAVWTAPLAEVMAMLLSLIHI